MSQKVIINNFFSAEAIPLLTDIKDMDISEMPIAKGAFGVIYECLHINGVIPKKALLAKIFKGGASPVVGYESIRVLQKEIKTLFVEQPFGCYQTITEVPALKAFPVFSFEGTLGGEAVYGYCAANLIELGFVSFDDVLDDMSIHANDFKKTVFKRRFQYCFHLSHGFKILNEAGYVHADINPKNLFVNIETGEAAIIDYDGGCVVKSSTDRPLTTGKLDDGEWLAPEIYEKEASNQSAKVDEYADRWSVSIGFHFLIFGFDPFFFVKEQSKRCKEEYLKANRFYPINTGDQNVSENAPYYIDFYTSVIRENVPEKIYLELVRNYEEGFFYPEKRTSYRSWMELFGQTQTPPIIDFFTSNRKVAFKGSQVTLSWKVYDAVGVAINNQIGQVCHDGEIVVMPDAQTTYLLTAYGHFGESLMSLDISVLPVPLIEYLKIPTPQFESFKYTPGTVIMIPAAKTLIKLERGKLVPMPDPFVLLADKVKGIRPPSKNQIFFKSFSYAFDRIKAAIKRI